MTTDIFVYCWTDYEDCTLSDFCTLPDRHNGECEY